MGKILPLVIVVMMLVSGFGCSSGNPVAGTTNNQVYPSFEIVIRVYEFGNPIDKIMQVFSMNGLLITGMQQFQLSDGKYEVRITTRNGNVRQLNELEGELRNVMNVTSVSISRI